MVVQKALYRRKREKESPKSPLFPFLFPLHSLMAVVYNDDNHYLGGFSYDQ